MIVTDAKESVWKTSVTLLLVFYCYLGTFESASDEIVLGRVCVLYNEERVLIPTRI